MYLFSLYLTFILCSLLFVSHFFLFPLTQQNTFWSKTFKMSLQEFLKKEFSDENIVFWIACENFRNISDFEEVCKKVILRNSNKGHNYSCWETLFERLLLLWKFIFFSLFCISVPLWLFNILLKQSKSVWWIESTILVREGGEGNGIAWWRDALYFSAMNALWLSWNIIMCQRFLKIGGRAVWCV